MPVWISQLASVEVEDKGNTGQMDLPVPIGEKVLNRSDPIERSVSGRPEHPVLDQQEIDIHFSGGGTNTKKVKAAIEDYSKHGYILTLAYPTPTSNLDSIASALIFRGHTEFSFSTNLTFELYDPNAKPWLHPYPYHLTFDPKSRKDADIVCTANSLMTGENLLISIPKKVEHGSQWMRVMDGAGSEVKYSSHVTFKQKDNLMIDVYRGEFISKICSINWTPSNSDRKFSVLDPGGSPVFSLVNTTGLGFFLHPSDGKTRLFVAATGFGWYIFRAGSPYRLSEMQEEIYLVVSLAFIEKAFHNNGFMPRLR
jgi:hypothetical protein